jgi:hypothetical protein
MGRPDMIDVVRTFLGSRLVASEKRGFFTSLQGTEKRARLLFSEDAPGV